jgi:hypothetical protein
LQVYPELSTEYEEVESLAELLTRIAARATEAERLENAKAVCGQCRNGIPLKIFEMGGLAHVNTMPCLAAPIWERAHGKKL